MSSVATLGNMLWTCFFGPMLYCNHTRATYIQLRIRMRACDSPLPACLWKPTHPSTPRPWSTANICIYETVCCLWYLFSSSSRCGGLVEAGMKISEKWPALYTDSIIEGKYNVSQRDCAILYISRSRVTLAKNIYGSQESFPGRALWLVAAKVIKPWSNKVSWLLTRGILARKCILLHLFPIVTTPTPSSKLRPEHKLAGVGPWILWLWYGDRKWSRLGRFYQA